MTGDAASAKTDAPADGADACATAMFSSPAASSLTDDFSTGMLTDVWAPIAPCIQQTGGELVAAPDGTGQYCHAWTNASYHLTCDSIVFKVPEVTVQMNGVQTFVYIAQAGTGTFNVALLLEADFVFASSAIPAGEIHMGGYDAAQDQWWKLDEHGGTLSFWTSADAQSWNFRGSTPDPISLDDVQIALGAGTWEVVATPGEARFHCYNLPPPCS